MSVIMWHVPFSIMLVLSTVALAGSDLEETEWRVEITPAGEKIPHHVDRLRFEGGMITSVIFQRMGFPTSPYTFSQKEGGGSAWEAIQKSDQGETLEWQGELEGGLLKGTMVWKKTEGEEIEYSLTGGPVPSADEEKPVVAGQPEAPSEAEIPWWQRILNYFSKPSPPSEEPKTAPTPPEPAQEAPENP